MNIYYKKHNNVKLFNQLENSYNLINAQNYIPIYNHFFNLSSTNFNSINLNNKYYITNLKERLSDSKFIARISDDSNNIIDKKIFIKYSPLIDPCKFMVGKYDISYDITILPSFDNSKNILNKVQDMNNSAYTDGFFSYLSSYLLNNHKFINGIDYYGGFLCIKKDFYCNIEDDIDYLCESKYFHENIDKLFKITNIDKIKNLLNNTRNNYKKININIDDSYHDLNDIIELTDNDINTNDINNDGINNDDINNIDINDDIKLEYNNEDIIVNYSVNNYDLSDNINLLNNINNNSNNTSSGSLCSSRSSNTSKSNTTDNDNTDKQSDTENETESETESDTESETDEIITVNLYNFPVNSIILECCENTLDDYILNSKISDMEWESIVLQILFTLITYQKVFNFTHNDLHTNNIVYINTDKKFIYYKYNNTHYKVPTYGKIYKIIDFGRAIYTLKNQLICSDSYSINGDANSQYNFEPYFDKNKKLIEPNYSFDLCRLGCSIFDYFVNDIEDIVKLKSPIKKLILKWVFDDKNRNILYKNNGDERYPDFKLYKMIARSVHSHVPNIVIKDPLFNKYFISKKNINKGYIINIDDIPILS